MLYSRRLPYIDNRMRRIRRRRASEHRLELAIGVLSFLLAALIAMIPLAMAYWEMVQ
jgi:hypothetical protein